MSALALFSHSIGFSVLGSDRTVGVYTERLRREGIRVRIGHRAENLPEDAALLVYSLAIPADAPEYLAALRRGVPVVSRAEYFGALMPLFRTRVGISGSHGKSTVTAMTERIFSFAYRYPTVFSGAALSDSGSSYRAGGRETLIYEACEYKDSFLRFSPTVAVALNLELDHTDYFPTLAALKDSFRRSLFSAPKAIVCADDENLRSLLLPSAETEIRTFGFAESADYRIERPVDDHGYFAFTLRRGGERLVDLSLNLPGAFQMYNAAAATVAALECGISPALCRAAIACFSGISRRMERVGSLGARPVYYDYAHHPTEIAAVIRTVQEMHGGALTVVFRPHTFSRTQALFGAFVEALSAAEYSVILDVDPIREDPIAGVDAAALVSAIGNRARTLPDREIRALPSMLARESEGPILLLGAGRMEDVRQLVCHADRFESP